MKVRQRVWKAKRAVENGRRPRGFRLLVRRAGSINSPLRRRTDVERKFNADRRAGMYTGNRGAQSKVALVSFLSGS